MTGQSADEAEKEVKVAIQRVFHWAAYTDKYGGSVQVRKYMNLTTSVLPRDPVQIISYSYSVTTGGTSTNIIYGK